MVDRPSGRAQCLACAPEESEVVIAANLSVVDGHVTRARAIATVDGREILTVSTALSKGHLSGELRETIA